MRDEYLYTYGIIRCKEPKIFGNIGISDPVFTVLHEGLGVVVSKATSLTYEPSQANLLAHERVVEAVLQEYTVIPMKFGTVFPNETALRFMMGRIHNQLTAQLDKIDNKVELGVKVYWPPEAALREVQPQGGQGSKDTRKRSSAANLSASKTELGRGILNGLNEKAEKYSKEIFEALRKSRVCVDARANRLIGHMILNAAFLVPRAGIASFEKSLRGIQKTYEPRGLEFMFSGPWPPYNFVEIRYE